MKILTKIIRKIRKRISSPRDWAIFLGVDIGNNNTMGKDHWSTEPYLIKVGSHCQLTNCKILTHGGGGVVRHIDSNFDCFGKVTIGDYVYIGTDSLIMPGVTIEDHVLVAAGSVVTKSIPSGIVVAGNPAKYVCTIEEYYERNKQFNLGCKGLTREDKMELLKNTDRVKFIKKDFLKK